MATLYEYVCEDRGCRKTIDMWRSVENRDGRIPCNRDQCGAMMRRKISVPVGKVDGLAGDRFVMQDKILANRQAIVDKGGVV